MTLPLSSTIEAGYLLLLGQLTITVSKVLFAGLLIALQTNAGALFTSDEFKLLAAIILFMPLVLILNIAVGWTTFRVTFERLREYPSSLFILEIAILILFFVPNNFISIVVDDPRLKTILEILSGANTAATMPQIGPLVRVLPSVVYTSSLLLCVSYAIWNTRYSMELRKVEPEAAGHAKIKKFNGTLRYACLVFFVCAVLAMFVEQIAMQFATMAFWAATWAFIHYEWHRTSPLERQTTHRAARSRRAASSPDIARAVSRRVAGGSRSLD